ncbi:hypothetical protein [Lichenicoccus sp.]|uniref:hypothetical protein n=1 Tax=Lichenicoccus sp. TaxID=2781899 RepID=UPI003D0A1A81
MIRALTLPLLASAMLMSVSACQMPGEDLKANVYSADQVNSRQAAKVIQILAVLPAQVEVDNSANRRTAQLASGVFGAVAGGFLGGGLAHRNVLATGAVGALGGGALGAAGGSFVPETVLVGGVSITYVDEGHTFNSAQVGKACEFIPGRALVIETSPTTTRVQPNASCPVTTKA